MLWKRPQKLSKEHKLREAALINSIIRNSTFSQNDIAITLGRKGQTSISQWFSGEEPTAIPDMDFIKMSRILRFDPIQSRPWLKVMFDDLSNLNFDLPEKAVDVYPQITGIVTNLSSDERLKLAGMIEALSLN